MIIKRIRDSYQEGSEVVIFGDEFGIVQGQPYEGLCKINKEPMKNYRKPPIYQFLKILLTRIKFDIDINNHELVKTI